MIFELQVSMTGDWKFAAFLFLPSLCLPAERTACPPDTQKDHEEGAVVMPWQWKRETVSFNDRLGDFTSHFLRFTFFLGTCMSSRIIFVPLRSCNYLSNLSRKYV